MCLSLMKNNRSMMEIYIHIPFCVRKCAYCDFLSFPADGDVQRRYKDALVQEIRGSQYAADGDVGSIFIGGGTPSVLPAYYIEEILSAIREKWTVLPDAEITIEANPGTVDREKLQVYKRAGISRISFGCQSAEDGELQLLGRIHSWKDFLESFALAREAGFSNINVDLMSALPGQSADSWEQTLRKVAELSPEHISAYSLIIEEGTPFFEIYGQGNKASLLPDEDEERLMYERTAQILETYGFHRYEISNYAKEGRECRHNTGYWTGVPYIGVGLGASSYSGSRRWKNTDNLAAYLKGDHTPQDVEELSLREQEAEFMILGLRMTAGVSGSEFRQRFGEDMEEICGDILNKYEQMGFMKRTTDRIAFTGSGISVSNVILADIYSRI